MTELLYEAQRYFPPKCRECPWLVGLIEDGLISPNEISRADVMDAMREHCSDQNFEACKGPEKTDKKVITCTLLWSEE